MPYSFMWLHGSKGHQQREDRELWEEGETILEINSKYQDKATLAHRPISAAHHQNLVIRKKISDQRYSESKFVEKGLLFWEPNVFSVD